MPRLLWRRNPLFIRSISPTRRQNQIIFWEIVAIPYSSGQSLQQGAYQYKRLFHGSSQSLIHQVNLSNSGLKRNGGAGESRNPLFIRSISPTLKGHASPETAWSQSLIHQVILSNTELIFAKNAGIFITCRNPLFIRSFSPTNGGTQC